LNQAEIAVINMSRGGIRLNKGEIVVINMSMGGIRLSKDGFLTSYHPAPFRGPQLSSSSSVSSS
jgi:hypothetical protein